MKKNIPRRNETREKQWFVNKGRAHAPLEDGCDTKQTKTRRREKSKQKYAFDSGMKK